MSEIRTRRSAETSAPPKYPSVPPRINWIRLYRQRLPSPESRLRRIPFSEHSVGHAFLLPIS